MPQHIRAEVEQQNAAMRHQRMMFSQEFLDFHQNVVHRNQLLISEEYERNSREGVSENTREVRAPNILLTPLATTRPIFNRNTRNLFDLTFLKN